MFSMYLNQTLDAVCPIDEEEKHEEESRIHQSDMELEAERLELLN